MTFVNIGYGNTIARDRIVLVCGPDSSPVKRMIQDARDHGRAIDVSCGRKTRSVIVTDSDHVILTALSPDVLSARIGAETVAEEE
ncbi:MAG: DUF370 domain-containing protein [Clostridia bacterium]|nr:DUF370 domain-containing protein [Clostridia bacterium]